MCSRDWRLRIQDILTAVESIQERIQGLTFQNFEEDEILAKAVLYDFIIIGEASRNVPDYLQERYPHIPWRLMISMRNLIAHEYFQVNLITTWNTIHNNFPSLVPLLQELLEQETQSE